MLKEQHIYGSSVAFFHRALLILGPSGSGKSALCLNLLARGADFIGDDRLILFSQDDKIHVKAEPRLEGQIEIRGMGIFECHNSPSAPVDIVVNLGLSPSGRLGQISEYSTDFGKLNQYHAKGVTGLADMLYLFFHDKIRRMEF